MIFERILYLYAQGKGYFSFEEFSYTTKNKKETFNSNSKVNHISIYIFLPFNRKAILKAFFFVDFIENLTLTLKAKKKIRKFRHVKDIQIRNSLNFRDA